jgi:hypothetical protein
VNFDPRGIPAAKAQAGGSQANFHRVPERRESDDFDLFPFEHSEVQ